jgi:hypothetical protein
MNINIYLAPENLFISRIPKHSPAWMLQQQPAWINGCASKRVHPQPPSVSSFRRFSADNISLPLVPVLWYMNRCNLDQLEAP